MRSFHTNPSLSGSTYTVHAGQTLDLHQIVPASGTIIAQTGSPLGALIDVATIAANDGRIELQSYGTNGSAESRGATLSITGTFINHGYIAGAGGAAGAHYSASYSSGAAITNSGTFVNTAIVALEGGQSAGQEAQSGSAATLTDTGLLLNAGTIDLGGAIQYYYNANGAALDIAGKLVNTGVIDAQPAGYYYKSGSFSFPVGGNVGSIVDSGSLANGGTILLGGAVAPFPGSYFGHSGVLTITSTGTFSNSGTIEVGGGTNYANGASVIISGVATDSGTITLDPGQNGGAGSVSIGSSGLLTLSGTITGAGTLSNSGQVQGASGHSEAITVAAIANSGTITAGSGATLTLGGSLTGTGSLGIDGAATLDLTGAVAAGQTVSFAATHTAGATLDLGSATAFQGSLAHLGAGDAINLAGVSIAGVGVTSNSLDIQLTTGQALYFALATPLPTGVVASYSNSGGTGHIDFNNGAPGITGSDTAPTSLGFNPALSDHIAMAR